MAGIRFYNKDMFKTLCDAFEDKSMKVFPNHRPLSSTDQLTSFVVVATKGYLRNYKAYQHGTIEIQCFAKDKSKGQADVTRLQELVDNVTSKLPLKSGRFSFSVPSRIRDRGSDGLGFTEWFFHLYVIINTTDSYATSDDEEETKD